MPTADFTLAQRQQANPLRALYDDYVRSGLPFEEWQRRLQGAQQPQMGPPAPAQPQITPPFTPPMGPPAPVSPPSDIQQLQSIAFLTPPEGITEPEVVSRQRAAFQMPERTSDVQELQGEAFNIPPEIIGTKEGKYAAEQALANVLKPSDIREGITPSQIPGLIQDISRAQAEAEGYTLEMGPDGKPLWVKKPTPGTTLSGTLGGLLSKVPVVGGALTVPLLPLRGAEKVLGALRVPQELQTATEVMGEGYLAARKFVKIGAPGTYGYGEKPTLEPMKAWVTGTREEAHAAFHTEPLVNQIIGSAIFDPLTYVGIGITGNVGKAERLAAATKTMQKARAAAVVRETLLGVPEVGGEFLTVEQIAVRAAPLEATSDVRRLLGISREGPAPTLQTITRLAEAEPIVPLSLGDAVLLPRSKAAVQELLRAREAADKSLTLARTARATGQVARVGEPATALSDASRTLEWTLREQTQALPTTAKIGEGGMSVGEAAARYRAGEGYFGGGIGGQPAVFHFYDEVDAMVNHLAGYGPVKISEAVAGKIPRTGEVLTAAARAAQAEAQAANPEIALAAKVSRLTALKPVKETWTALARTERATILERAALDTNLARSAWLKLPAADRAAIVQEFRRTTQGFVSGTTQTPTAAKIVTPAEAAGVAAPTAETLTLEGAKTEFLTALKEATSKRPLLTRAYHVERVKRTAKLGGIRKGGLPAGETLAKMKGASAGKLAADLQAELALRGVSVAGRETLLQELITSPKLLDNESMGAQIALTEFLDGVKVPTPSATELLERALGPEIGLAIRNASKDGKLLSALKLVGGIPTDTGQGMMALLTSYDVSAGGRQGIIMAFAHPFASALAEGRALRMTFSQGAFDAYDAAMRADPYFDLITKVGKLPIQEVGMGKTPEQYAGRLTRLLERYLPGIKQSERGFVGFLNQQRYMIVRDWLVRNMAKGEVPAEQLQQYSRSVAWATGVGSVSMTAEKFLKPILWTPKLTLSRFEYPFSFLTANGAARWSIIKDEVAFAGGVATILGLAKLSGVADVEIDPRSTDVIKIRVGNTRIDISGGEGVLIRSVAQLVTGQRKEATGKILDVSRWTVGGRFIQSKLQPLLGLLYDIKEGHTFVGEELTATGATLRTQIFNRLAPLAIQDTVDAVREWGVKGLAFGVLAELGLGVQTYKSAWTVLISAEDKAAAARTDPATGKPYTGFAALATAEGTQMALAIIAKDPEVIAARASVDAYRTAHGGARPMTEMMVGFLADQLEADGLADSGDMTTQDWRVDHTKREAAKVSVVQGIIMASPDLKKKYADADKELGDVFALKNPTVDRMTAAYFTLFEKYANSITGQMDVLGYEELDQDMAKFRAQFTAEQLEKLDANIGASRTDREKEYYADRQAIEDAGWWELRDSAWPYTIDHPQELADALSTKTNPVTVEDVAPMIEVAKKFETAEDYRDAIYKLALAQTGATAVGALSSVDRDSLLLGVASIANDARAGLVMKDPRIGELVAKLGYQTSFRQELIAPILASQGITVEQANAQLMAAGLPVIGTAEQRTAAQEAGPAAAAVPVPAQAPVLGPPAPAPAQAPAQELTPAPATAAPIAPEVPVSAPAPMGGAAAGAVAGAAPTPTGATSFEGIVAEKALQAITAEQPPPTPNALDVAHALAVLGGRDMATTPAGLPPDQLKAKLAGDANWGGWIDPQTWLVVGGLGLQGKATLLPMFWTLFNAGTNSTLDKTIRKDKDVQAVLLGLSHLGNATVEQYMRAFNAIVGYFTEELTTEEASQAEKLSKNIASLQKKQEAAAKSAAKKAETAAKKETAAGEKEAAAQAEQDRWSRLLAELGNG